MYFCVRLIRLACPLQILDAGAQFLIGPRTKILKNSNSDSSVGFSTVAGVRSRNNINSGIVCTGAVYIDHGGVSVVVGSGGGYEGRFFFSQQQPRCLCSFTAKCE